MFTDIHCHILNGVDDGAVSYEDMKAMLSSAYADGIRCICATPHFNYTFYGDNVEKAKESYLKLKDIARESFPDLELYLGCEIFYHNDCISLLNEGKCPTLADTKYVLCDFSQSVEAFTVINAINVFVSQGYRPILAHTERYRMLCSSIKNIKQLYDLGAIIQINAPSIIGKNGRFEKRMSRKLVKLGLCDVISTDAHNLTDRTFCMSACSLYLQKHYGKHTEKMLTNENARAILKGQRIK